MSLFTKVFGTYSERQLKAVRKTADIIESLAPKYAAMSDAELRGTTAILKDRLAKGETLDDILPDAFAAIREADERVLGKRPFYVQLLGGIVLHQGRIAEMKTGEGKTLVATMPAYLNALSGNGVHIVTVNDYLARYGCEEMSRVYGFMGLTTGLVVHGISHEEKKQAYAADITYGTNNEYGFDYLRDNMVTYKEHMVQRGHAFAIVDEVDSILIDEARTPLIISGAGEKPTDLYEKANAFVLTLTKKVVKELDNKEQHDKLDADYIVDEKANNAILTSRGAQKAERFFGLENYADEENATIAHHVNQAIRAHGCMHIDQDYIVNDQGVIIVDTFTGRLMYGRRFSDGLHQAIEAKEGVVIEKENKTLATITFQNYFRMYGKLSGMTGTALTEDEEFREIYSLDVVEIPTNMPMIRVDHTDVVYTKLDDKYKAIIDQIKKCHEKGQPVLVGTVSVEKSELLSEKLKKEKIPHHVLNAKYHEREAEIVAQAGKFGAVTISTNMAGRGTDIMLGGNPEFMAKSELRAQGVAEELVAQANSIAETTDPAALGVRAQYYALLTQFKSQIAPEAQKVREAGGLFIVGTERHESRRIDNQLRGRSGRQGDPGESRFFLSMEDDLLRLFGTDRIPAPLKAIVSQEGIAIDYKMVSGFIQRAQQGVEGQNFRRRKYVLSYDDVMNQQRNIIYSQRREVLNGNDISNRILHMIGESIKENVAAYTGEGGPETWNLDGLRAAYLGYVCGEDDLCYDEKTLAKLTKKDLEHELMELAEAKYNEKEAEFGEETFRELERTVLLRNVDTAWIEHIDAMDDLKGSIGMQAYAQRDPVTEYRIVGGEAFDAMIHDIRENTVRMLLSATYQPRQEIKREQIAVPLKDGFAGQGKKTVRKVSTVRREAPKVGRNDSCPCGSGKKYKNCCGSEVKK